MLEARSIVFIRLYVSLFVCLSADVSKVMDKFSTMEGKSQIVICLNGPVDERLFVCPSNVNLKTKFYLFQKTII